MLTYCVPFLGLSLFIEERNAAPITLRVAGRDGSLDLPPCVNARALVEALSRPLIVTRHKGLVEYLIERNPDLASAEVIPHAGAAEVTGRIVIGVLPPHLARLTMLHVEIPLNFTTSGARGSELTAAQVAEIAGPPRIYRVSGI